MNKELEEDKKQINKMLVNIYDGLEFEDDEEIRELYLKQKHALKTALNYIDNSISKEAIKEKIKKLEKYKDITTPYGMGKLEGLYELLEGK